MSGLGSDVAFGVGQTVGILLLRYSVVCTVESVYLYYLLFMTFFVRGDDSSISKGSFMQTKHLFFLIHIRIKGEVGIVKHV